MILFVFIFWSSAKKTESFFASQILKTEVVAIICYSASSKLKISGPKKLREANAYFAGDFYVLWGKSAAYSGLFETDRPKPGISKLGPAGKIWPAKPFHRAREEILSVNKNFIFTKNLLIL